MFRNPLPQVYKYVQSEDSHLLTGVGFLSTITRIITSSITCMTHFFFCITFRCAERKYDVTKFHSRGMSNERVTLMQPVSQYPFYDHNAPPLGLVADCCKDIVCAFVSSSDIKHEWLEADKEHVVGINCKAGKGRTGLIICCYLLFSKTCATTDEALKLYGEKRTKNGKV